MGTFSTVKPWQFINPKGAIVACAWCQKEQGVAPLAGESHGICPSHMDAELAKIGLVIERDRNGVATMQNGKAEVAA